MPYTEIKQRKNKRYYYRALSVRKGRKITKQRIYLGVNLSREILLQKERESDKKFSLQQKTKQQKSLEDIKKKIRVVLKKYHVKKAGIFGSYARGEQKRGSDIDIIIQPTKDMGFAFAGLEIELSEQIGKKVDLVSYNGLNQHLKSRILGEEIRII